ncbi:MAG: acetolactate decarboxylase [bacterium]
MIRILLFAAMLASVGCARREEPLGSWIDTVTVVSILDDFKPGAHAGRVPFADLLGYGRFGIGTEDGFDGEMMILDGRVYRFDASGQASVIDPTNTTPSATVTFFEPDAKFDVSDLDDAVFRKTMDWKRPPGVRLVAFRVTGLFDVVKTRSVPSQSPPVHLLSEVATNTVESEWRDTAGIMMGFYFPDALKDVTGPGYHLHFIDKDGKHGGHVLSFRLRQGRIEMDSCSGLYLMMSTNSVAAAL